MTKHGLAPAPITGVTGGASFSRGLAFRPFGWSADGKFAWLESREIDGRGGTVYLYIVYDAVEDARRRTSMTTTG